MLGFESLIASLIVSFPPVFDTVCINVVWTKPDELVCRVFAWSVYDLALKFYRFIES